LLCERQAFNRFSNLIAVGNHFFFKTAKADASVIENWIEIGIRIRQVWNRPIFALV
jgi:hypothetical protein